MPNNFHDDEPEDLPQSAKDAFAAYSFPHPRDEFDARFWRELDNRKNRYRGFVGFLRRLVEVEIEGVAVWRLAASTFSGGALCTLAVGIALQVCAPKTATSSPSPLPEDPISNAQMYAFAFRKSAPGNDLWDDSSVAPQRPASHDKDFSCTPLNAPWA